MNKKLLTMLFAAFYITVSAQDANEAGLEAEVSQEEVVVVDVAVPAEDVSVVDAE